MHGELVDAVLLNVFDYSYYINTVVTINQSINSRVQVQSRSVFVPDFVIN